MNENTFRNNAPGKVNPVREKKSRFFFSSIVAGIFAAVGMALLVILLNQVGTFSTPFIMFVKYILLGIVLYWVLSNQQNALHRSAAVTKDSFEFSKGIRLGGLVTLVAAITLSIANVFLPSGEATLENGNPTDPSSLGSSFINGGVEFMLCLVFGMIFTFISLQFLKRGRPGEESLTKNSAS